MGIDERKQAEADHASRRLKIVAGPGLLLGTHVKPAQYTDRTMLIP
jgi:hypothetical protein